MERRTISLLCLLSVILAVGCSRDDEIATDASSTSSTSSTSTSSTTSTTTTTTSTTTTTTVAPPTTTLPPTTVATTPAPTEPPTTTAATTTTLAPGACPALPPLPAGAVESAAKAIDVDANGTADTVRTYAVDASPTAGEWHVRIEVAAGGGVDIALPDDPAPGAVKILGGAYVGSTADPGPGGLRPALFVTTGAGASASIVTLFRFDACTLAAMLIDGSGTATFPVGAGVTHAENLRCDGTAGTTFLVYQQIMLNADGVTFDVLDTAYTRTGSSLVTFSSNSSNQLTFPNVATLIACAGVDHP